MNGDDPHALRVPATRNLVSQYLLLYTMSSSAEDFDSLIDPAHRVGVLRVYLKEDSTRFAEELIARLRARLPGALPPGIRVEITGSLASSEAMNEVMVHGKILNILQIAAIILLGRELHAAILYRGRLGGDSVGARGGDEFRCHGSLRGPARHRHGDDLGDGGRDRRRLCHLLPVSASRRAGARSETLEEAVERTLETSGMAILFVSSAIAAGYLTLCFSGFAITSDSARWSRSPWPCRAPDRSPCFRARPSDTPELPRQTQALHLPASEVSDRPLTGPSTRSAPERGPTVKF